MNIETKTILRRFAVFLLFWTVVLLLGFFFSGGGAGGSGGGNGSGSAAEGSGTGRGSGTENSGTGRDGGTQEKRTKDDNNAAVSGAWGNSENPDGEKVKQIKPEELIAPGLMVHRKEDLSEDTATIHLPQHAAGDSTSGGTQAGFFGIRIKGSDRILFLLDTSGSMSSTTADGSARRIDLMKREMNNALAAGHNDAAKNFGRGVFRIVNFDSSTTAFPLNRRCSFASSKDISEANHFVRSLHPDGGTNMLGAWNCIIPMIRRDRITTVCFLSDGDPSDCTPEQLLALLRQSVPDLRIHTVVMGKSSDLLKQVAKQHRGICREVF